VLVKALEPDVLAEAVRSAVAELQADHAAMIARRSTVTNELAPSRRESAGSSTPWWTATPMPRRGRSGRGFAKNSPAVTPLRPSWRSSTPRRRSMLVRSSGTSKQGAADLRGLLARHVAQARQVVRMLLEGRLVCQPFDDGREKGYTFTATGTYRRLGVPVVESVNVGGGPNEIRIRE
jgi:hypothetical protein